jgi:hypothetical protein
MTGPKRSAAETQFHSPDEIPKIYEWVHSLREMGPSQMMLDDQMLKDAGLYGEWSKRKKYLERLKAGLDPKIPVIPESEQINRDRNNQLLEQDGMSHLRGNERKKALVALRGKKADGGAVDPDTGMPWEFDPSRIFAFADGGVVDRALMLVRKKGSRHV